MFAVTVTLRIDPPFWDRFCPLIEQNAKASRNTEPGCLQFDVCTSPAQPQTVFLYELYTDRAAFDAHMETTHFQEFDLATAEMIIEKTVHTFENVIRA